MHPTGMDLRAPQFDFERTAYTASLPSTNEPLSIAQMDTFSESCFCPFSAPKKWPCALGNNPPFQLLDPLKSETRHCDFIVPKLISLDNIPTTFDPDRSLEVGSGTNHFLS